jgi:hypothetical protein
MLRYFVDLQPHPLLHMYTLCFTQSRLLHTVAFASHTFPSDSASHIAYSRRPAFPLQFVYMSDDSLPTPSGPKDLAFEPLDFPLVNDDASIDEVRKADIKICNQQLNLLAQALPSVRSLGGLLMFNREIREMVKYRRDILGLEYGASSNKAQRVLQYEPLP